MNIFKEASRENLKYKTVRGSITTDQLWELPLTSSDGMDLDTIAKDIYSNIKDEEISFVSQREKIQVADELRLDVIKDIIEYKQEKANRALQNQLARERKSKLLDAIAAKEDKALDRMSADKLRKEVEAIDQQLQN